MDFDWTVPDSRWGIGGYGVLFKPWECGMPVLMLKLVKALYGCPREIEFVGGSRGRVRRMATSG